MNSEQTIALKRLIESARAAGFYYGAEDAEARTRSLGYLKVDTDALIALIDRERPAEPPDIDAIRARAEAATPGPWTWWGEADDNYFHLCTKHSGMLFIMGFARAGMQSAQPMFRTEKGHLEKGKELAIYQVAPKAMSRHDPDYNVYRGTIIGFRSPDAAFIASARADMDALLTYIERLEGDVIARDQTIRELGGAPRD